MNRNETAVARGMEREPRVRWLRSSVSVLTALTLLGSACALESRNPEVDPAGSRIDAGGDLLYFIATAPKLAETPGLPDALAPEEELRSVRASEADFQTLSGERFRFQRARSPEAVVPGAAIKGVELREDEAGGLIARIALEGDLGDRFLEIRQSHPEHFLLVKSAGDRGLDYLPTVFAVRRDPDLETGQVWVAAGAFRDQVAAETFFADLGDMPMRMIALSEAERGDRSAEDAKMIEYALWLSVCDAAAAAELGEELTAVIETLPDAAGRRSEMDCARRPRLGGGTRTTEDIRR